jgi:hypothetical protein
MINVAPFNIREKAVDNSGNLSRTFHKFANDLQQRAADTLAIYRQTTEPKLTKPDQTAIWVDTTSGNNNATYLVFCHAVGTQVKTQLT